MTRARLLGDRMHTVTTTHHTPYLSPSRFSLYDRCPQLYKLRYVDGIKDPPTIDMEYGSAIHAGLEAMFSGGDSELVFMRDLRRRLEPLIERGADPASWLVPQGLSLISAVERLKWQGQPERRFWWTPPGFVVPITGFIDLYIPESRVVVDWKTTQHPWSATTAERYAFQRALYTASTIDCVHELCTFRFVALGAYPGGRVQVVEATMEPSEVFRTLEKAREIGRRIEAEDWLCTCKTGHLEAA
jgi:hypothetical protein